MHPDPLHTKDLIIIAVGAMASAVGKAKPIFDAPPVGARY
ncbi:hypothetical protein SAMN04515648_3452 [Phyllobacterium sp. CL33Tsu]|nr:hypothetical protein SAMN04515648_3452 [Phyllobacterium sp. CL33Tsu]